MAGSQGAAGPQGEAGVGGTGPIGPQGARGFQGIQGITASGGPGPQGAQGTIGPQGFGGVIGTQGVTGIQGPQGPRGFQGPTGSDGADSTVPGPQGVTGIQGIQGPTGSTGNVDVQNLYGSGLQGTAMFVTLVQGGSGGRPLYGTLGPNPGSQQNFFYTADADELTLENITVDGGITLNSSTLTSWPSWHTATADNIQSGGSLRFNDNIALHFGTGEDIDIYDTGGSLYIDCAATHDVFIREGSTTRFSFDTGTGELTATDFNSTSDARLKENVNTIENALDKVLALRGVEFNLIDQPDVQKIGLIAQEVESVLPQVVNEDNSEDKIKSVSYSNIVALLIEAIKEQQKEIEQLKNRQ